MSSRIDHPPRQVTPWTPWQSIPKAMQLIAQKIEAIYSSPRQTDIAKQVVKVEPFIAR